MTITRFAVAVSAIALSSGVWAQDHDTRRAELLRQRERIDAELRALDAPAAARPSSKPSAATGVSDEGEVVVTARALSLTTNVTGQTVTNVDDGAFRNTPATTIADIVKLSPGVAVTQGNGPR